MSLFNKLLLITFVSKIFGSCEDLSLSFDSCTVNYHTCGGWHSFKWKYDSTVTDTSSGISAFASGYDSGYGATQHAIFALFKKINTCNCQVYNAHEIEIKICAFFSAVEHIKENPPRLSYRAVITNSYGETHTHCCEYNSPQALLNYVLVTLNRAGFGYNRYWGDCRTNTVVTPNFQWFIAATDAMNDLYCIPFAEPSDPHTWTDNYLCSDIDLGLTFHNDKWSADIIKLMNRKCIQINEPADPYTWDDNYLCYPRDLGYDFSWSYMGVINEKGVQCIQINEPSDPHTWTDNYLCYYGGIISRLGLEWSYSGPINGKSCSQIIESSDPHTWDDNYLCTNQDCNQFSWGSAGPHNGQTCTQIIEASDPHTWNDNYLCVPYSYPYQLSWYSAGPGNNKECIQIIEPSDPHTWNDNYLCIQPK